MKAVRQSTVRVVAERTALSQFDSCIADFDGVVQEMTVLFAQRRWPGVELEPWLYTVDGKPQAAALIMLQKLPARTGKLAVLKWGPVLRDELATDREIIHQSAIDHLVGEYAVSRGMMLSVMAHAEREPPLRAQERLWASGFRKGTALPFPMRYIVNVRLSDSEQRKSFGQKWRYHLSKSEKEGLAFEVAPATDLSRFDRLYQSMTDRKRFPDYSAYDTTPYLMQWDNELLRPQLFFVRKNDVDVAGAMIFKAGRTAVYLYGATNDDALPLRAGYFMHARIISWLRDNTRAHWYDLGGTDGFQGLHQFKKGMVGTAGRMVPVPPIANYAHSLRARLAGNAAYAARDGFQKLRKLRNRVIAQQFAKPDQDRHR